MERTVTIRCPVCSGEGVVPSPEADGLVDEICETCDGEGWLDVEVEDDS